MKLHVEIPVHFEDPPGRVWKALTSSEGGTDLVLRHTGHAARHVTEGLDGGWPRMLDRLRSTAGKEP